MSSLRVNPWYCVPHLFHHGCVGIVQKVGRPESRSSHPQKFRHLIVFKPTVAFMEKIWFKVLPGIWWLDFGGHHTKLGSLGCLLWENLWWNGANCNFKTDYAITCIQTLGLTTLRPIFALSQPELTTAQPDESTVSMIVRKLWYCQK